MKDTQGNEFRRWRRRIGVAVDLCVKKRKEKRCEWWVGGTFHAEVAQDNVKCGNIPPILAIPGRGAPSQRCAR